jgi:hypothetical protein
MFSIGNKLYRPGPLISICAHTSTLPPQRDLFHFPLPSHTHREDGDCNLRRNVAVVGPSRLLIESCELMKPEHQSACRTDIPAPGTALASKRGNCVSLPLAHVTCSCEVSERVSCQATVKLQFVPVRKADNLTAIC